MNRTVRVLLDNNAIGDLYRSPLGPSARRTLRRLVKHHRCEVLLTVLQLTELAGMESGPRHRRLIREMLRLSRGRVLQAYPHRVIDELRLGKLRRRQYLYKKHEVAPLLAVLYDDPTTAKEKAGASNVKAQFIKLEATARAAVKGWPNFKTDWLAWKRAWTKDRDAMIADWAADEAERRLADHGKKLDRSKPFDFRRIPSLWHSTAFHLARIRLLTDDAAGLKPSDVFDHEHFGDSAYADVLVTSDKGMSRIIAETGLPSPRVISFGAFAEELRSGPLSTALTRST